MGMLPERNIYRYAAAVGSILPAVKRNITHSARVIESSSGLLKASKEGPFPADVATSVFKDIVSDFADVVSFAAL
jgi:hypothetical protein